MEARYKCKWMQKMRWSQKQLFGVAVWMQQNEKQLVQTQWMHSENVIETQWHHKGLWEVSVQAQSMSYCVYTSCDKVHSFGAPMELSWPCCWRPYVTVTASSFSTARLSAQSHDTYFVHAQSARRHMAFYNVQGDPTATRCHYVVTAL